MKSKHPNTKMPTDEEMVEAFKAYDKDGDGKIQKKEMEIYIKKTLGLYWEATISKGSINTWNIDNIRSFLIA